MNRPALLPRGKVIEKLSRELVDVLVIGGGIVGAGIARDAAMRGLKVALVEQHDFAFGTSSRSSRLLHGGLRYLAQGRIGLVREASAEKKIIHRIAPHLAEPLPFLFPTYQGNRDWVLWQLKLGVKLYDLLCGGKNLGRSTWLNKMEVLAKVPFLAGEGLQGAVRYYDGFTNDARLVIDTLRSAAAHGASLLNYARLADASRDGDGWRATVEDRLHGAEFQIRAQAVVNATGPWAERLPQSSVKLRLTKGIHLVIDRARLPVPDTVVMTEGKRILFAIPWGERVILGTTDTDYEGPLDEVTANAGDIDYVLGVTNRFFPQAKLERDDVISHWAGLRPLLADPRGGKPSDISRSHQIRNPHPGWWDVAGGKLTTYRLIAEQAVNGLVRSMKKSGRLPSLIAPCRTADEALLPPEETACISAILPPEVTEQAVEHYCAKEWAVHLGDVMARRTNWHSYRKDAAETAEQVARWMGSRLGWTDEQRARELHDYHQALLPI